MTEHPRDNSDLNWNAMIVNGIAKINARLLNIEMLLEKMLLLIERQSRPSYHPTVGFAIAPEPEPSSGFNLFDPDTQQRLNKGFSESLKKFMTPERLKMMPKEIQDYYYGLLSMITKPNDPEWNPELHKPDPREPVTKLEQIPKSPREVTEEVKRIRDEVMEEKEKDDSEF